MSELSLPHLGRLSLDEPLEFRGLLIIVRSVFGDILNIVDGGEKIDVGTSVKGTPYDFSRLFDEHCEDIYLIGQNLRALLSDPGVFARLHSLLRKNEAQFYLRVKNHRPGSSWQLIRDESVYLGAFGAASLSSESRLKTRLSILKYCLVQARV